MKKTNTLFLLLAILAGLSFGLIACDDDDNDVASTDADSDSDADSDTDAAASTVTVDYGGDHVDVDLGALDTATIGGVEAVPFSGIIAKAFPDVDLSAVTFDIEASDGYKPGEKLDCETLFPVSGADASKGGLDLAAGEDAPLATWDASLADLAAAGCAGVKWVSKIHVADK